MTYLHPFEHEDYSSPREIIPYVLQLIPEINSVIDIGCGQGTWLKVLGENEITDLVGIDSSATLEKYCTESSFEVYAHDLNMPFQSNRKYDLAMCLEVAEHLEERPVDILINSLVGLSDYILFSAAVPNQGGFRHVNEQWPSYWAEKFKIHGYQFLDPFRNRIWNNEDVSWVYRQNLFFVVNSEVNENFNFPVYNDMDVVHPDLFQQKVKNQEHLLEGRIGFKSALRILGRCFSRRIGLRT